MKTPTLAHLDRINRDAWDRLYGQRSELIWGRRPVGFLAAYLEQVANWLDPSSRVLDAACGEGRNLPSLAELPGELYACDASENALAKASSWQEPDVRAGVAWHQCTLEEMPFGDGTFDFILACDVLQTLPDLPSGLAELRRVLKPGGHLLCNMPNLEDGIADDTMTPLQSSEYLYQDQYFFRFLEVEEALEELSAAGLTVLDHSRRTWIEEPHPGYRQDSHSHTSWVYLARRDGALQNQGSRA